MTQSIQPITYLCERCGRAVDQEVLTCPDQPQGRCLYLKKNLVPNKGRLISVYFFLFGILGLSSFWAQEEVDVFAALLDLILIGWGLFGISRTSTLLYNPISKMTWKRTACLGIALKRTLIPGGKVLYLDLSFPQPLLFPPSVTKLSEFAADKRQTLTGVAELFRASLVGLLARGAIQIHHYQEYVARGWGELKRGQELYVFTACEETDLASINGALERKIYLVLRSWSTRKGEEALEWPDGPPVYELIRAVYGQDVSSPAGWVFDLVAQDAVACQWGQMKGWPRKCYKPNAADEDRLWSERVIINGLLSQFVQQQPILSKVIADQISSAVASREIKYDYLLCDLAELAEKAGSESVSSDARRS